MSATTDPGRVEIAVEVSSGRVLHEHWSGFDARGTPVEGSALPLYCLVKPMIGLAIVLDPRWPDILRATLPWSRLGGVTVHDLLTHRACLAPEPRWASAIVPPSRRTEWVARVATTVGEWRDAGYAYSEVQAWVLADEVLRREFGSTLWELVHRVFPSVAGELHTPLTPQPAGRRALDWIEAGSSVSPMWFCRTEAWSADPTVWLNAWTSNPSGLARSLAEAIREATAAGGDGLDAFRGAGRFSFVGYDHAEDRGPRAYGVGTMTSLGLRQSRFRNAVGHLSWQGRSGLAWDEVSDRLVVLLNLGTPADGAGPGWVVQNRPEATTTALAQLGAQFERVLEASAC